MLNCKLCKKEYDPKQKYCSDQCRYRDNYLKRTNPNEKVTATNEEDKNKNV